MELFEISAACEMINIWLKPEPMVFLPQRHGDTEEKIKRITG